VVLLLHVSYAFTTFLLVVRVRLASGGLGVISSGTRRSRQDYTRESRPRNSSRRAPRPRIIAIEAAARSGREREKEEGGGARRRRPVYDFDRPTDRHTHATRRQRGRRQRDATRCHWPSFSCMAALNYRPQPPPSLPMPRRRDDIVRSVGRATIFGAAAAVDVVSRRSSETRQCCIRRRR